MMDFHTDDNSQGAGWQKMYRELFQSQAREFERYKPRNGTLSKSVSQQRIKLTPLPSQHRKPN